MSDWRTDISELSANLSSATLMRLATSGLPFVIYAYLFRVFSTASMATLILTLSIAAIIRVVINFGFDVSAVKAISQYSHNENAQAQFAFSVLLIQSGIFLCLLVMGELIFTFIEVANQAELRAVMLVLFGEIFILKWFYQARLRLEISFRLALAIESSVLILTLLFINQADQQVDYLLLRGTLTCIGGMVAMLVFLRLTSFSSDMLQFAKVKSTLRESLPIFKSRLVGVLHDEVAVLMIATWFSSGQLTSFDLARKLINLFCIPNSVINTVTFSYISRTKDKSFTRTVFYLRNGLAIALVAALVILAEPLLRLLGGADADLNLAKSFLLIMSILVFIRGVMYFLGTSVLVSFGYERYFNRSVYLTFILFAVLMLSISVFSLASVYLIIAAIIISESFEAIYRYMTCKRFAII